MNRMFWLGLGAIMMATATAPAAQAQDAGAGHVVTYVEVNPQARKDAAALLRQLREATRKDEGNLRADVVESGARPGQFVILTSWKDQRAFDAHLAAAHTK